MKRPSRKLFPVQVLVVEDDPSIRKLLHRYLEGAGMGVEMCSHGKAALEYLAQETPQLICLDLMLPEVSGYDVIDFLRANPRFKDVPVLVISARTLPADRARAEEMGVSAYLTKPFSREDLLDTIKRLVGG